MNLKRIYKYNNMRRNALAILILFVAFGAFANIPNRLQQAKDKSESERFVRNLAKIKCDEINYAYISFNMIRQMFAEMTGGNVAELTRMFSTLKSMRRFVTTGDEGYMVLKDALSPFLQGEESVMGMELMAFNRGDGVSVVYSGSGDILVIADSGDNEIALAYFVGLRYDVFMKMSNGGIDIDLGF